MNKKIVNWLIEPTYMRMGIGSTSRLEEVPRIVKILAYVLTGILGIILFFVFR